MNRKIRTLLFSTLYPSSVRPGHGIFVETRLRELLNSGQVETKVVAPVPWFPSVNPRYGKYALFAQTPEQENRNGVEVWHPRYFLPPRVGMTLAPFALALGALPVIRGLQRDGFDFDLIDAHYYYPDGVAAALLARYLDKPLVITARGSDISMLPQYPLVRKMILRAASQAQATIAVCRALSDELAALGGDPKKLHVMRNGVDLIRFRPIPRQQARAELGLLDVPTLLSVGNLVELKGHALVIRALLSLPGYQLVIAGTGPDGDDLRRLARELGLAERVRFVGSVAQESLYQYYSAADALVLASSRECWANVLLESMACGTPVVATRVWWTPEVVGDSVAGRLVDSRNPSAFVNAVKELMGDYPSRSAVRAYAEGFAWEGTSKAQVELFGRIVRADSEGGKRA